MSTQFFSKLSQNFIEILKDDEYYDITIEVGEDPNVKIFRAHMIILCHRSPYLRRTLVSNERNDDNILSHVKLPNILPEIFQSILKYIYGGILATDEYDTSYIFNMLVAANELLLCELVDYLQTYLIENRADWMEQNFKLIYQTSFQSNQLLELQKFCTDLTARFPEKIFKSFDFTSIPEKSLISLLNRDDLQMRETEVWDRVLRWGLAKNQTFTLDSVTWTDDDFKTMEITLKSCLPLIRFYSLSSKDFFEKVHPYKKLLKTQIYEDLLKYYLDLDSEPSSNVLPPRCGNFDSKIINMRIVSLVSKWIDKVDVESRFSHKSELYLPYEFKLLLRGSRDGFTPTKFHSLCDDKPKTVTFIKVKGTEEILGGYNPIIWKTDGGWETCRDSFIFSFKNKHNPFKGAIKSNVARVDRALFYGPYDGVSFSYDLYLSNEFESDESTNYEINACEQDSYEKEIRDTKENFSIEDYEVFQIINKHE